MAPRGTSLLALEWENLFCDLKTMPCLARAPGEPRELLLVRKELAEREARISKLEQTLQQREEARTAMVAEHESLRRQVDDARTLVAKVEAARAAREAAEAQAKNLLAGSPSAQQLLARELQELQEAEDRAREAREQRRKAATQRKAAVDAELSAKAALRNDPAAGVTPIRSAAVPTPAAVPPASGEPAAAGRPGSPAAPKMSGATSPPTTNVVAASAGGALQQSASPPASPLFVAAEAHAARTPLSGDGGAVAPAPSAPAPPAPPTPPPAPSATPAPPAPPGFVDASWAPPDAPPAAMPVHAYRTPPAPPSPADALSVDAQSSVDADEAAVAAAAEVEAALQVAAAPTHQNHAAEDEEDFDTMGWPDDSSPSGPGPAVVPTSPSAPALEAEDVMGAQMMADLRAEAAHAAARPLLATGTPSPLRHVTAPASTPLRSTVTRPPVRAIIAVRGVRGYAGVVSTSVRLVPVTEIADAPVSASPAALLGAPPTVVDAPKVMMAAVDAPAPAVGVGAAQAAAGSGLSPPAREPLARAPPALAPPSPAPVPPSPALAASAVPHAAVDDGMGAGVVGGNGDARVAPAAATPSAEQQPERLGAPPPPSDAAAGALAAGSAALDAQHAEVARLNELSRLSASLAGTAEAALITAGQQEDEALRELRDVQAKLQAARQAEEERQARAAAAPPPAAAPKKKGGLWGMGKKKAATPQKAAAAPEDDAPDPELAALEDAAAKFTQLSAAMAQARAAAAEQAEHARQKAAADTEKVEAASRAAAAAAAAAADEAAQAAAAQAVAARDDAKGALLDPLPPMPPASGAMPSAVAGKEASPDAYLLEEGEELDDFYEDDGEEAGDVDSDFELLPGAEPPSSQPLLEDFLQVAKLYGHDGLDAPPPDDIEWDRRWTALYDDGTLWHADEAPRDAEDGVQELLGRVELKDAVRCDFSMGRTDEICLSQDAKCHLLRLDATSTTELPAWREQIAHILVNR